MATHHRQDRLQSLREFLLSQALTGQLDDGIVREALAIIKLPAEKRDTTQLALVQLLEEWRAGNIGKDEFIVAWRRVIERGQGEAAEKGGGVEGWMPVVVLLALVLSALSSWIAYKIWFSTQPEIPVALAAPPPEAPYQDTNVRAYVSEGFALADMAKVAVAEYYMSMGVYPRDNAQAGLAQPSDIRGNAVSSVAVSEGGVVTVTFNQFVGEGQTVVLEPTSSGGGPTVWDCKKGTLPARYRPPHCR